MGVHPSEHDLLHSTGVYWYIPHLAALILKLLIGWLSVAAVKKCGRMLVGGERF